MKSWSNFHNFSTYIRHGEVKSEVEFLTEVVLWPFLLMHTKSGQSGSKPGQQVMCETRHGELNCVQY